MPRIVAGHARGRRLAAPPGDSTRPTSDRAREALFSAIESLRGPWLGARVLDLFAGSGAVGLEASSRGAAAVVLVERDVRAAAVLRKNVEVVGGGPAGPGSLEVRVISVERAVADPGGAFDLVFADPPYAYPADDLRTVLTVLQSNGGLTDDAVVVVERATRDPEWIWPVGFEALRSRAYGEGTLWYGRAAQGLNGTP